VAADLAGFIRWSGRWMGAGSGLADREGIAALFYRRARRDGGHPCNRPFMGTAIGAAIGEPGWVVFLVFTALGLGLACPSSCFATAGLLKVLAQSPGLGKRLKSCSLFRSWPPCSGCSGYSPRDRRGRALKVELGLLVLMVSLGEEPLRNPRAWSIRLRFLLSLDAHGAWGATSRPAAAGAAAVPGALQRRGARQRSEPASPVFVDFTAACASPAR